MLFFLALLFLFDIAIATATAAGHCGCLLFVTIRHVRVRILHRIRRVCSTRARSRPTGWSRNRHSRRRQSRNTKGTCIEEDAPFAIFLLMIELDTGVEGAPAGGVDLLFSHMAAL